MDADNYESRKHRAAMPAHRHLVAKISNIRNNNQERPLNNAEGVISWHQG
jgi:hypothetical protein